MRSEFSLKVLSQLLFEEVVLSDKGGLELSCHLLVFLVGYSGYFFKFDQGLNERFFKFADVLVASLRLVWRLLNLKFFEVASISLHLLHVLKCNVR